MKDATFKYSLRTVPVSVPNQRAERERLFAGLESFVNAGDSLPALQSLRAQLPAFLPAWVYDDAEYWAAHGPGTKRPLLWYREQLRKVWEGRDPQGVRLSILLGIEQPPYWSEEDIPAVEPARPIQLDPTFEKDAFEWLSFTGKGLEVYRPRKDIEDRSTNLAIGALRETHPTPDWRTGEIRYEFRTDFQRALYALMRESWRARICRVCGKYFIASKPARQYCSSKCFGAAKRERDLGYWRHVGSIRRDKRLRRRKKP